MSWPTQEQFDKASELGHEYALQEYSNGRREAQESPLSGEWADGMTPRMVAHNVGWAELDTDEEQDAASELASAWETGYNDAWAHSLPVGDRHFKLDIQMSNDQMLTGPDITAALERVRQQVYEIQQPSSETGIIKDVNGQTVGAWTFEWVERD